MRSRLITTGLLGLAALFHPAAATAQSAPVAIRNVSAITWDRGVIENATIVVRDGRIEAVGADVSVPAGAEVVDGSGLTALPGIVDAEGVARGHGISGVTGRVRSELVAGDFFDPFGSDYRPERALRDLVAWGVTASNVKLSDDNVIDGVTSVVKLYAPETYEDHFVKYRAAVRVNLGESPRTEDSYPTTRMGIAALVRQEFIRARDYDRRRREAKPESPVATDLRLEPLAAALRGELPVIVKAVSPLDIETALRLADELDFRLVLSGSTQALEAHVPMLRERDVPVILGTYYSFINSHTGEQIGFDYDTADLLASNGITVAFGGLEGETKLLTVNAGIAVQNGMDHTEALKALTLYPARILGVDDRLGSLAAGRDADIVLYRGDPLEITSTVEMVFIGGVLVHRASPFDATYTEIGPVGGAR